MKNSDTILLILGVIMLGFTAIAAAIIHATSIAFSIIIGMLLTLSAIREHDIKEK